MSAVSKSVFCFIMIISILEPLQASNHAFFKAILPVEPPKISSERITYTVDLLIQAIPKEFWIHYDSSDGKLIIEFFNTELKYNDLYIRGVDIISKPEVLNLESPIALSGKSSQIRFSFQSKWHNEVSIVSDSIMRLQIWKYLEISPEVRRKKPTTLAKASIIFIGISLVSLIATLIFRNNSD